MSTTRREEIARIIEPQQFAMVDQQRKTFPNDNPTRFYAHPAIVLAFAKADRILDLPAVSSFSAA
jgi:hypothetical protein